MNKKTLQIVGLSCAVLGTVIVAVAYFVNNQSVNNSEVVGANIGTGMFFLFGALVLVAALISLALSLLVKGK